MFAGLEFKYPSNVYFLIAALAAAVFFALAFGKKEKILNMLNLNDKIRLRITRTVILAAGLGLVVFSLLGPQVFSGYAKIGKTGLDIYILIDTSKSMLVSDIKPDRITLAKKIAADIINSLQGDRIGLIPFASDAYIQMPLTDDYQLARMFLNVVDTEMISGGGTDLTAALRLAADSFKRASGSDRVILIISDGEDHDGRVVEFAKNISDDRIRIYTIGVGTERGGLVPVYDSGGAVAGYINDADGNPVTSRLDPMTMRDLARAGNGSYYQVDSQGIDASALIDDLAALKRDLSETESVRKFEQLYQYYLGAGIVLILICWFLPETKKTGAVE